jgi:hypothetical protein
MCGRSENYDAAADARPHVEAVIKRLYKLRTAVFALPDVPRRHLIYGNVLGKKGRITMGNSRQVGPLVHADRKQK